MKILIFIFFLMMLVNCSNNKTIYWCGDHPCVNKKERKAYFKETMTVEVRNISKYKKINKSESDKITEQAILNKKKIIKQEKALAKQARLEEKRKIKEEKKEARLKKKASKKAKKQKKKIKDDVVLDAKIDKNENAFSEFNDLVDKITKKNILRPFPNINDIPN